MRSEGQTPALQSVASAGVNHDVVRFEPAGTGARTLRLGSFSLDLPDLPDDHGSRTLGYRYNFDYSEREAIEELPIVPALGIRGSF